MSPRLIRALLENGIDSQLDPDHKARMIDEIMAKALASEKCLKQMDSTVAAVNAETIVPSLNMAIEAGRATDRENGGFADMARNLREMAAITTIATHTVSAQAEVAVGISQQVFQTLEEMIASTPRDPSRRN